MSETSETNKLIKKVLINRTKAYLGESFRVLVKTTGVTPLVVMINGAIGKDQYLQFGDYAGKRKIIVTVQAAGQALETQELDIEILSTPPCLKFPIIDIVKDYASQYLIRCSVKNIEELGLGRVFFEWDLGLIKTFSEIPTVNINLTDQLEADALYQNFNMTLTIHLKDETKIKSTRSFTLWNDYAFAKRFKKNILPLTEYDFRAVREKDELIAACTVKNLEDSSLFISRRQIEFLYNDPERISSPGEIHDIQTIVVEPKSRREINCSISFNDYPKDAWGYAIHFHGRTDRGYEVHVSGYFEYLTNHQVARRIIHPVLIESLNELRSTACRQHRNNFSHDEVTAFLKKKNFSIEKTLKVGRSLSKRNVIGKTLIHSSDISFMDLVSEGLMPVGINEGDQCLPDQEPPSEEWVCQLTDEWAWIFIPDRIMNARKGDVVLSPSGQSGPVSLVLHSVSPPQHFAHTGIMVQNFYTLRHSTASDDWLQDEDFLAGEAITGDKGTEGLDPDRLKYIWPGTVTQSVAEAFHGSWLPDPEGHKDDKGNVKAWRIKAFDFYAKDNGNNLIIDPLVVKPNALLEFEIPKVRTLLHEVAEEAKKINGHYRFFCYTNSAVVFDPKYHGPMRANWWGSGTLPTMCSNFIWAAIQQLGKVQLEGPGKITRPSDLEAADTKPDIGAAVDNKTLDGLYFYDEAERRTAAKELYRMYYDIANEKTWWRFGNDAPDDVASQICNTFAFDWTGEDADGNHAKDSEDYENPGDGRAVSPANILLWDSPKMEGDTLHGLYGFFEKLIYRPARLEWRQVSRWKKVSVNGTLTGLVSRRGMPQSGAFVTAGGKETITGPDGRFSLTIRAGRYTVESRILADGFMWEGNSPVDVPAGGNADTIIQLKEPSDWFRDLSIFGTMNLKDEENFGSDEFATRTKLFRQFRIGAFYTHEEDGWTEKMGGEVRAELSIKLDWQMIDSSVNVFCTLKLFEGTSEDTGDLDGEQSMLFNIKKDVHDQICTMFVRNDDEDDDDHVELILKISNRLQP